MNMILVAGASGIAGTAAVRHFAALPDWEVIALSRRPPRGRGKRAACAGRPDRCCAVGRGTEGPRGVTHVAYMAL